MNLQTDIPNFEIRFAKEEDTALILRFIKELAQYEQLLHEVVATEEGLREQLFERKAAQVLIAEEGGQAVGFALYFYNFSTFLGRQGIYLEDLYITPAARGKGYGKALFKALAQIAHAQGCERVDWWCLDWNQSSIAFYKAMGAIPMNGWTVYRLTGENLNKLAQSGTFLQSCE
ncbi:GNAT family N-acetyltransferase [Ruminococcaceae bacterium OttesenSCG-928-N02]|nr:GNAT family N-acetyltransferase [Ruminococcaceae bacterium OttesenSCG-928-N02]